MEAHNKFTDSDNRFRKNQFKGAHGRCLFATGFLFLAVGAIFLLFNMGVLSSEWKSVFLSWQMVFILIGLLSIINGRYNRNYIFGGIVLFIGAFFILPKLQFIYPDLLPWLPAISFQQSWPVILLIIGAVFIIKGIFRGNKHPQSREEYQGHRRSTSETQNSEKFISLNSSFNSSEYIILSSELEGGIANVNFGEIKLDLRKAGLAEGNIVLETNVTFGSIILYVPENWDIAFDIKVLFGSSEDKRHYVSSPTENAPKLLIVGSVAFGSVELRN